MKGAPPGSAVGLNFLPLQNRCELEKTEPPEFLYRYMRVDRCEFVKRAANAISGKIYFPRPKDFNDPFDFTFGEINAENSYNIDVKCLKDTFQNWGVYCLCEKPDNLLMWSHYADAHRGICLQFDTKKFLSEIERKRCEFINKMENKNNKFDNTQNNTRASAENQKQYIEKNIFFGIEKISYETRRAPLNNIGHGPVCWVHKFHKSILKTKFIDWKYEKEWRIILTPPKSYNEPDKRPIIFKFAPCIVSGVMFGFKMDQFRRNKLMKTFKKFNPMLRFYQARESIDGFFVTCFEIKADQ